MPNQRDSDQKGGAAEQEPKKRGRKIQGASKKPGKQRSREYRTRGVPLGSLVLTAAGGAALAELVDRYGATPGEPRWTKREIVSAALACAAQVDLAPWLQTAAAKPEEKESDS